MLINFFTHFQSPMIRYVATSEQPLYAVTCINHPRHGFTVVVGGGGGASKTGIGNAIVCAAAVVCV